MSQQSFATLGLKPELLHTLSSLNYQTMTPIQAQALPLIVANKDVIGQAKTGSGKTAAFALGLLNSLNVKRFRIQTLVMCPTRELADQVAKEIRTLARGIHNIKVLTLCGGTPMGPQIGSLEHGAHIIVGTPGRIEDHLNKGRLDFSELTTLVLDEADRMLEMGFQTAMDAVIDAIPAQRQTLLFSATMDTNVEKIANKIMHQPTKVKVESNHNTETIKQHFYEIEDNEQRMHATQLLVMKHLPESCVIFCNTKRETQDVADQLWDMGFDVLALHGDLEQRERDQVLVQFANKSASVLVATDVAARGLDIENLDLVINYHLAHDTETHIHRIGRTGRAGQNGHACSLVGHKDGFKLADIEDYLGQTITPEALPSESVFEQTPPRAKMKTIRIDGGKKQKVRAGDILGCLTGEGGIEGSQVGKIKLHDLWAFVAVNKEVAKKAVKKIENGKLKGRKFRAWTLR